MISDQLIEDIKAISFRDPFKILEAQMAAIIREFGRQVMKSGEACPCCGKSPADREVQ
jgi:hypothetical protein